MKQKSDMMNYKNFKIIYMLPSISMLQIDVYQKTRYLYDENKKCLDSFAEYF